MIGCYAPEPRPFAGRGGRSLDQAPRHNEPTRYIEPSDAPPPQRMAVDPDIDPRTVPPGVNLTPPAGLPAPIDPGMTVAPPSSAPVTPPAPSLSPAPAPSTDTTASAPPAAPKPAPSGDIPYARPVPGKPGYVYSPHEPKKILDVTGMRPGTMVQDPQTGAKFRVP